MKLNKNGQKDSLSLTIGWLYPDLMSTYGDRGNVIVLTKRCQWRGIDTKTVSINFKSTEAEIRECDIILGGGAQDRQQEIVSSDLLSKKSTLQDMFENGTPGLFVCGSPQLLGHSYFTGDGRKLIGLGIFDMETKHFGHDKPRCIGNTVGEIAKNYYSNYESFSLDDDFDPKYIVGFENHGGRTYLGSGVKPFAKVIRGYGNNGEDGTEGAVFKNVIACYYHGPFLPKNVHLADWLIKIALEAKYQKEVELEQLDDEISWLAHAAMLTRSGVI